MDNMQLQLRDIASFDQLSSWPPAPIWWILIAVISVVIIIAARRVSRNIAYKRSWQYDATCQLVELEQNLNDQNAHESLIMLSELIKRIIIQKYGREHCASLVGKKLLSWLSQNDPYKFDWQTHGKILIEKTYAPYGSKIDLKQIRALSGAIKEWVTRDNSMSKKHSQNPNMEELA